MYLAYTQYLSSMIMARPGPNIPLNLPIIQELCSLISTPLFKRKLPIILKKLMWPECTCIWYWKVGLHATFLSCKFWGSRSFLHFQKQLSTGYLGCLLQCFLHLTTGSRHMAQSFLFQTHPAHAQCFLEQLKSTIFNFFRKLPIFQKIIPK